MFFEMYKRIQFWNAADRLGPDILSTYWRIYFKTKMIKLCKSKFKYFDETADFRPGAYAIGCSKIYIGKNVVIRPGCMLHADTRENGAGIIIEDDVLMGSGVHIYVDKHKYADPDTPILYQGYHDSREVCVSNGSWIGAKVVILPVVTIGENSVVGAGSIVTKTVASGVVVAGNPAKAIKVIR